MKTSKEIAEKARERTKKQNERAKETWDNVSCRLPKGTKERITRSGFTVNGFINTCVLEKLKQVENNTHIDINNISLHTEQEEISIREMTQEEINRRLTNNTEYLSNVTESSRTNENDFDDKIIDNDIKIDSGAFKKHVPTEQEETDNRMRLLKLQEEINARKTCIIKPVEQEPALADIQLPDKPPF